MDHEVLVKETQKLTVALDETKVAPKAVMISVSPETGNWKVWIVPRDDSINRQEFYRIVSEQISRLQLFNVDIGSIELRESKNAAIQGMSMFSRIEGVGAVNVSNNRVNGVLLPDGIVVRMDMKKTK